VEALGRYIDAVRAAGVRHGTELVIFGHAGDGNLHVNLLPDVTVAGWEERIAGIYADVTAAVISLGGTLSGEHGDGRLRAAPSARSTGPRSWSCSVASRRPSTRWAF
jgi:FAD/FMN-containing dehydrogenase